MIPNYAMIEPTTVCNLKCISCFREDMIKDEKLSIGSFSEETLDKIHEQLPNLEHIRFHGMGELFLLKNHVNILEKLRKLYPTAWIELVTNGQYPKTDAEKVSALVNRITFSMTGADKISYEQHHVNALWELLITNIKQFVEFKSKISLEINYVCMTSNSENLSKALNFCADLNIDTMRVNLYQDWSGKNCSSMKIIENEQEVILNIKNAIKNGKKLGVSVMIMGNPEFKISECQWMNERVLISYNGDVLPCCMRPDHKLSLGNILSENIHDIWNRNKIEILRAKQKNETLSFCQNCPYKENIKTLKGLT